MDTQRPAGTPAGPPHEGGTHPGSGPPPPSPADPTWSGWGPPSPQGPPPGAWGYPGSQAGGASGIPPTGPSAPGRAPAPKRRRRWIVGLLAAVLAVAGIVAGVLVVTGAFTDEPVRPAPPRATQPAPSPAPAPEEVTFRITDTLDEDIQVLEVVTVSSGGVDVGTVEISTLSPEAVLPVTARPGPTTYELYVRTLLVDDTELTCVGQVTIDVRDEASYAIGWTESGGQCVATLIGDRSQT